MATTTNVLSSTAAAQRDASRRKAELHSDATIGRSRANADFNSARAALSRALQRNVRATGDDFAGRGIWDSGLRRSAVADLGTDYAADIGSTNTALQRELENIQRGVTKGEFGISTGLEGTLFGNVGESLASILQRALNDARNRNR